jgi:hypothetical protein
MCLMENATEILLLLWCGLGYLDPPPPIRLRSTLPLSEQFWMEKLLEVNPNLLDTCLEDTELRHKSQGDSTHFHQTFLTSFLCLNVQQHLTKRLGWKVPHRVHLHGRQMLSGWWTITTFSYLAGTLLIAPPLTAISTIWFWSHDSLILFNFIEMIYGDSTCHQAIGRSCLDPQRLVHPHLSLEK